MTNMSRDKIFLDHFLSSKSNFQVFHSVISCVTHHHPYSPAPNLNDLLHSSSKTNLFVLDSSYNPPHNGHKSLITTSVKHYKTTPNSSIILLLLSVNNADKIHPTPVSFPHRMAMMELMAKELNRTLQTDVILGLTKHAKFIDKFNALRSWEQNLRSLALIKNLNYYFLVGYDTLIRIFDPKYYLPKTIGESLASFMANTNIFVLTRNDGDKEASKYMKEQQQYVDNIANGELGPDVPNCKDWASKIQIASNTSESLNVSSSGLRKMFTEGVPSNDTKSQKQLPNDIFKYIKDNNLYTCTTN